MRTPPRSTAPRVPFLLLIGGLLVGGLVLLLALNTASAANELQRGDLATKDQEVSADVAQLRIDVAASAAPGNLARAAQALGMVPAGHPAFILEQANGKTILRGRPKPVADNPLDLPQGTRHTVTKPTTRGARTAPTSKPPSGTTSPSGTKSPSGTTSPSHHPSRNAAKHAHRTVPATPTGTPTITLPGGNR